MPCTIANSWQHRSHKRNNSRLRFVTHFGYQVCILFCEYYQDTSLHFQKTGDPDESICLNSIWQRACSSLRPPISRGSRWWCASLLFDFVTWRLSPRLWWWVYYPDYVLSLTSLPHSWWLEWQLTRPATTDAESDLVSTLFCPSCQCSSCLYSLCLAPLRSSLLLDLALTEPRPTTKSTGQHWRGESRSTRLRSFLRACLAAESSGASQLVCLVRPNLTARLMYRERKVLPQLFSLRYVLGSSISACPWNICVLCLFTFSRLLFFAIFLLKMDKILP